MSAPNSSMVDLGQIESSLSNTKSWFTAFVKKNITKKTKYPKSMSQTRTPVRSKDLYMPRSDWVISLSISQSWGLSFSRDMVTMWPHVPPPARPTFIVSEYPLIAFIGSCSAAQYNSHQSRLWNLKRHSCRNLFSNSFSAEWGLLVSGAGIVCQNFLEPDVFNTSWLCKVVYSL